MLISIIVLLACLPSREAKTLYLPGVTPHTFQQHDEVKLYVDKLTSTKTQMPYDYYSLPYCKPDRGKKGKKQGENLGEVLSGARSDESVYKLSVKVPKSCEIACVRKLSKHSKQEFIKAIEDEYRVHWMLDNLPVGIVNSGKKAKDQLFARGFPVGFKSNHKSAKQRQHFLYNHIRIIAQYHDDVEDSPSEGAYSNAVMTTKIVGFRVEPMSIDHRAETNVVTTAISDIVLNTCNDMTPPRNDPSNYMNIDRKDVIVYSYDVFWERSHVEWTNRWDIYLSAQSSNEKVHWFSITNSVMIVLFLTAMIAMILLRTLRKDIAQYNDPSALEEAKEESGWKLVHGDVFRPPQTYPMVFSVFVGTGLQLLTMCFSTLSFALMGLQSPTNRGSLITAFILLFVFMGAFAGYSSAVVYKMFRCTSWTLNTLVTAFFFPGVIFCVLFVLNLVLWSEGSSGAIPISSMLNLLFLWICVSVPLVFLGAFFGYKREIQTFPVRTNLIPRTVPPQFWYMHPFVCWALGGILPFGAVSVELYFIMSALWLHHIYYIFGFLSLVVIILIITCAEVSILLCYFQLCAEDYRWWWNSFLSAGSCAGYMMLYAIWYNITELELTAVAEFVYYSYMTIISFTFFLLTGTIGYLASLWFTCQIYSSIKVD